MTIDSPLKSHVPSTSPMGVRSPLNLRSSLVLLAAVLVVTILTFGVAVLAILLIPGTKEFGLAILGVTLPVQAALLVITIHWRLRREGTGWRQLGFTPPTVRILHLLWQIPLTFVALLTTQWLAFAITGNQPAPESDAIDSMAAGTGPTVTLMLFIGVAFLTPIWEEAIFRGVLHGGMRRRFGPLIASVLSAALFALCHGVPVLLPYMATLGLALAFLREFHQNLWAPLIMHVTLNSLVTGALVLPLLL